MTQVQNANIAVIITTQSVHELSAQEKFACLIYVDRREDNSPKHMCDLEWHIPNHGALVTI